MVFDTLILGGTVIDGSGRPGFRADVGILDGKIAALGSLGGARAKWTLDAAGQLVTPGFIDIHRHADAALFRAGFGASELYQGLTTIINGNCGLSIAPSGGAFQSEIFDYLTPVTGRPEQFMKTETMASYLAALRERGLALHVGMLAGGGTIRAQAAGLGTKHLQPEHYRAIHLALERALSDGALGVSLGLGYAPECFYQTDELIRALAPLAGSGVPVVVHMRQEGSGVEAALSEMIEVARALKTHVQISHMKAIGRENWRAAVPRMLQMLRRARDEGVDIACDVYPYTAGSTQLIHILPPQSQEGGLAALSERLRKAAFRAELREKMLHGTDFENLSLLVGWENILVSSVTRAENRDCEGRSIREIADLRGQSPFDAAFDLLADEQCEVTMIDEITHEEDIEAILRDEASCVISDSTYPLTGLLHPRVYGTYARLFTRYVLARKTLSPEQAVQKVSALPAKYMRLGTKGKIAPGMDADINIFRLEELCETARYDAPEQYARGMQTVLVAGEAAIYQGRLTGQACGKVLESVKC